GPVTMRFNDSLLLQSFGLGWLKLNLSANHGAITRSEDDAGHGEPLDELSSTNAFSIDSKGISGKLVEVNLGKKAESQGRLSRLQGVYIHPTSLVVQELDGRTDTRKKTDNGVESDKIRYSGGIATGELKLELYDRPVPGADPGKRFFRLAPGGSNGNNLL